MASLRFPDDFSIAGEIDRPFADIFGEDGSRRALTGFIAVGELRAEGVLGMTPEDILVCCEDEAMTTADRAELREAAGIGGGRKMLRR